MHKYSLDEEEEFHDTSKSTGANLLRSDNELFKDEDNIAQKVISVRRTSIRKGEDWEILENGKVVLVLKSARFTNQEKDFLKTVDGMRFLMDGYKNDWNSVMRFKAELKKVLK